jgi:farnesyl-diphosphate farnesyltransferase
METNVASSELLTHLLRDVSRSFYLTLRVLPHAIRPQIGLAYLLARTTDTIADTEIVALDSRLQALAALRQRILGEGHDPLDFGALAREQGSPSERALLERVEAALAILAQLAPEDRHRVQTVLDVITTGQELDLKRFAAASVKTIAALQTEAELDDYTYRVAGCVGEFWTKMCRTHLFPCAPVDDALLLRNGVRFGQGLQLVNILRDLPSDLRKGRCYVPADALAASGLPPSALLEPAREPAFRPLYDSLLDKAHAHLEAGWEYTHALPRGCVRVRLACAWPILIGVRTLALLRQRNVLDPAQRIKVTRAEVRRIIVQSVVCYPWPLAWQGLLAKAGRA